MEDQNSKQESFRDSIATINEEGSRQWIFPKKPKGRFYDWRKWVSYFLLILLFAGPFMTAMTGMKRHMRTIEIITGVLLVVTGLLFLTGGMEWMAYTLLEAFPALQQFG